MYPFTVDSEDSPNTTGGPIDDQSNQLPTPSLAIPEIDHACALRGLNVRIAAAVSPAVLQLCDAGRRIVWFCNVVLICNNFIFVIIITFLNVMSLKFDEFCITRESYILTSQIPIDIPVKKSTHQHLKTNSVQI